MRNFLRVSCEPNSERRERAIPIGMLAHILASSRKHRNVSVGAYFSGVVVPALRHQKVNLYFDERGDPVGYFIWVLLAPETENRILQSGLMQLHESEFTESGTAWVVDFAAPFGHAAFVLSQGLQTLSTLSSTFRYIRRSRERFWIREFEIDSALRLLHKRTTVDGVAS